MIFIISLISIICLFFLFLSIFILHSIFDFISFLFLFYIYFLISILYVDILLQFFCHISTSISISFLLKQICFILTSEFHHKSSWSGLVFYFFSRHNLDLVYNSMLLFSIVYLFNEYIRIYLCNWNLILSPSIRLIYFPSLSSVISCITNYIISHHIMLYHMLIHYIVLLFHIILHHIIWYHIISYHILNYIKLCRTI